MTHDTRAALPVRSVPPAEEALIFIGLGKDEAFEWLDKACDERAGALPFLNVNPRFNSLRRDPRFVKLRRRVGLD